MHVLATCKNEEDTIKNERVVTTFLPLRVYWDFSRRSRTGYSAVRDRIRPNFELFKDFMDFLLTCKNEEDTMKIEGPTVATTLNIDFPDPERQITP